MQTIKKIIKNNKVASDAYYTYRRLHNKKQIKKYCKLPIEADTVLFSNFNGRGFACNPRAIAEALHERMPDARFLWTCTDRDAEITLPDYITPIRYGTGEYYKALSTSGVWVTNELLQEGITKRPEQLYIQTYHGDKGFKKVGYDALDLKKYKKVKNNRKIVENTECDCFLAGSDYAEKFIRSAFAYEGKILKTGTPRNDVLVKGSETAAKRIREKLGIGEDEKILLYAPTFRDKEATEGKVGSNIDLEQILDELSQKYGTVWRCLLRAHGGRKLILGDRNTTGDRFIDVTGYPDMANLLLASDFLITDYSSCAGDFALTGKPILLYQGDIDDYLENNRTLYFKMEDSPFFVAHDMTQVGTVIRSMTRESVAANDRAILAFYGSKESGSSSENVCDLIEDYIKKKK